MHHLDQLQADIQRACDALKAYLATVKEESERANTQATLDRLEEELRILDEANA